MRQSANIVSIVVGSFLLGDLFSGVSAYRSGSPTCSGGTNIGAFSGGLHGNTGSGGLSAGSYEISLGGLVLKEDGSNSFSPGMTLDLTLSGPEFKGFMIRSSSTDGTANTGELSILDGENSKILTPCDGMGVSGVTHPSRDTKTSITISFEASGNRLLEVLVVQNNSPTGSDAWYGSSFSLMAATNPPTSIPTSNPTSAPTSIPTSKPTSTPTSTPSTHPTSSPSSTPSSNPTVSQAPTTATSAPTVTSSDSPSSKPSSSPSSSPSVKQSAIPTLRPSFPPSSSPSALPTIQPSNGPSNIPSAMPSEATDEELNVQSAETSSGFVMPGNTKATALLLFAVWFVMQQVML